VTHDFCRLLLRSPKTTSFNSAILRPGPSGHAGGGHNFWKGTVRGLNIPDTETFRAPEALCCLCLLFITGLSRTQDWAISLLSECNLCHYQPLKHRLTMAGTEASCLSRTWLKNRCQRVTYFAATNFSSFSCWPYEFASMTSMSTFKDIFPGSCT